MMALVKFLHFVGLMAGAAAGIANMMIAVQAMRSKGDKSDLFALRRRLSNMGLGAILLLWITGVWLYASKWQFAALGPAFIIKIIAATLLLAAVFTLNIAGTISMRTGNPPPGFIMKLAPWTLVLVFLAVAGAVWAFN